MSRISYQETLSTHNESYCFRVNECDKDVGSKAFQWFSAEEVGY